MSKQDFADENYKDIQKLVDELVTEANEVFKSDPIEFDYGYELRLKITETILNATARNANAFISLLLLSTLKHGITKLTLAPFEFLSSNANQTNPNLFSLSETSTYVLTELLKRNSSIKEIIFDHSCDLNTKFFEQLGTCSSLEKVTFAFNRNLDLYNKLPALVFAAESSKSNQTIVFNLTNNCKTNAEFLRLLENLQKRKTPVTKDIHWNFYVYDESSQSLAFKTITHNCKTNEVTHSSTNIAIDDSTKQLVQRYRLSLLRNGSLVKNWLAEFVELQKKNLQTSMGSLNTKYLIAAINSGTAEEIAFAKSTLQNKLSYLLKTKLTDSERVVLQTELSVCNTSNFGMFHGNWVSLSSAMQTTIDSPETLIYFTLRRIWEINLAVLQDSNYKLTNSDIRNIDSLQNISPESLEFFCKYSFENLSNEQFKYNYNLLTENLSKLKLYSDKQKLETTSHTTSSDVVMSETTTTSVTNPSVVVPENSKTKGFSY